jgi:hypothetical protein
MLAQVPQGDFEVILEHAASSEGKIGIAAGAGSPSYIYTDAGEKGCQRARDAKVILSNTGLGYFPMHFYAMSGCEVPENWTGFRR